MQAPPFLRATELSRSYRLGSETVQAVASVSFELPVPTVATLVGRSGSGKSTLLNIVGALENADSGRIELQGTSYGSLDDKAASHFRRERLGFIFQSFNLVPVLSAVENVELSLFNAPYGRAQRRREAQDMLRAVGLGHRLDHLPGQMSGGEQQRVAVARALVRRPALVVADEPTANLDTRTTSSLVDLMLQLNAERGVGFLIATHDDRLVDRVGKTFQLEDGRLHA